MSEVADRTPRTKRGAATRERIVNAAVKVFAELGYAEASIVRITEEAGIGQGTFYLYFESKLAVFEETVESLNRRVRQAMSAAAAKGRTRIEAERLGFEGFFRFTAEHPALYRIVRESEFVSPRAHRQHYARIVEGYVTGLQRARDDGEIEADPTVAAWALMGMGEMIGMRWVLWGDRADIDDGSPLASDTSEVPPYVIDEMMQFIQRGLGSDAAAARAEQRNDEVEQER